MIHLVTVLKCLLLCYNVTNLNYFKRDNFTKPSKAHIHPGGVSNYPQVKFFTASSASS